jgi:hypothetical protein
MSETPDLARHLFDHVTITGTRDPAEWVTFKAEHRVEAQQIEPVLIEVIGHLRVLAGELTQETGRLSVALSQRA